MERKLFLLPESWTQEPLEDMENSTGADLRPDRESGTDLEWRSCSSRSELPSLADPPIYSTVKLVLADLNPNARQ